jgi:AraC-like DNA-binding protein
MNGETALGKVLGFNDELERQGFRRLARLDIDGCRSSMVALAETLDFAAVGDRGREVALLLLDVLQRINRKVHRPESDGPLYQEHRESLLAGFAGIEDAEQARLRFTRSLSALLQPLTSSARAMHPLVVRARAYIDEFYAQRLSLSTVAEALHVSANYLSRLFRREMGMTLTTYVQRVRLEHAMMLLAEGGRSISEIAYLVGYQNYRDFYRNFVKYENASPREIRQRLVPSAER